MVKALLLMLVLSLNFAVAACEREGPAERTGEEIDEAVEETREGFEEAGEETQEGER